MNVSDKSNEQPVTEKIPKTEIVLHLIKEEEKSGDESTNKESLCGSERGNERLCCKICSRDFLDKEGLLTHEEKYVNKKTYKCSTCEKA